MWHKSATARPEDVGSFTMPALKDDMTVGRSADHVEREAYQKGYEAGEKAGLDMGLKKAGVLIDKLEGLLRDLHDLRSRIVKEAAPQLITLAMDAARKIVMAELKVRPEVVVNMTKDGLMKLERSGQITIKINPAVYELITKHKPELTAIYPDIAFDVDPSVSKYGSVVVGPAEEVVTELDEQLKNLIKDMAAGYGAR